MLSAAFGPIRNIVLGRMFTISDFGVYSLSLTVIGLLYPLFLFGQQRGFIRFFIKNSVTDYDWRRPIMFLLFVSFVLSCIIIPIISWYYDVGNSFFYFCICAITSSLITELLANVVRSSGKYELALLLQRSIRIIIAITAVILFLGDYSIVSSIFFIFGTIHFFYGLFIFYYVINKINIGSKKVPTSSQKEGLYFSIMDAITLANAYGINLIIAGILSLDYLGIFFAVTIILRVYDTFVQSTDFVVMPSSGEINKKALLVIIFKNLIIGSMISLFFIIFGKSLLSLIYAEKYDEYLHLVPYICMLGCVKMMDVIPSSIVSGISKKKTLKQYVFFNMIITLLFIPGSIFSIKYLALKGAACALITLYTLRSFFGFGILYNKYKLEKEGY
jgi:O-antigen/teichoic acid export membrane protein